MPCSVMTLKRSATFCATGETTNEISRRSNRSRKRTGNRNKRRTDSARLAISTGLRLLKASLKPAEAQRGLSIRPKESTKRHRNSSESLRLIKSVFLLSSISIQQGYDFLIRIQSEKRGRQGCETYARGEPGSMNSELSLEVRIEGTFSVKSFLAYLRQTKAANDC
jgi:hypothetical protein